MKKLLIINREQFGYNASGYYYSKYLKDDLYVTYMCFDETKERIHIDGVNVKYVSREGLKLRRGYRFLKNLIAEIKHYKYDIVLIRYFQLCSLLKFFNPSKKFILDIRTGSVARSKKKRFIQDIMMKLESLIFDYITIISLSLVQKLKINKDKVHLLPVGADILSSKDKDFKEIKLLYIGTLSNRNIDQTIIGFKKFYEKFDSETKTSYKIIGYGSIEEENKILKTIRENNLEMTVEFLGRIPHNKLKPYFDESNVGISYVPITDYYQCQPPSKTFEYVLSGLVCIATATSENKKFIDEENGVLCKDNPEDFYKALIKIFSQRNHFNSKKIRESLVDYQWENIVKKNLKKYIEDIIEL
jgi:glycosyltransferase involved in cell wall biosynthesis